ncbi:hypothetical protein [Deferrisoma camini]|uniref:hypothetical protein n=1 Tax=Deferrisoma camini TaxID=1035120 RepID=UPI00046CD46C|nr:hypothetical protein [Deferrisoma camini]
MTDQAKLQELLEKSASTDLAALLRVKEAAKQAMMAEPSAANVRAFNEATRALEEARARLAKAPAPAAESDEADSDEERFPNLLRVLEYLQREGWKIGKSALYQHRREGRIRQEEDGTYTKRAVDRYARTFLKRLDGGGKPKDELEALQRAKLRAEKEKTEAQARHWELRTKIERGYYVKRSEVETALAARAVVLRSGFEDFVRAEADQMVKLVEGNPERAPDLVAYLLEAGEEWFDQYSDDKEFVAVIAGPDLPHEEDVRHG